MDIPNARWSFWTLPAYLLWLVFFLAGFDPEMTFQVARDAGFVVTQNAMVNSPHVITLALAAYFGFFAYQRCMEAGLRKPEAQTQGLQFAILALIAFLAFSPFQLLDYAAIPVAKLRFIVLLVGGTKLFMWFLLLGVVARYYLLGHARVFASMVSVLPSGQANGDEQEQGGSRTTAWTEARTKEERQVPQPTAKTRPEPGNEH